MGLRENLKRFRVRIFAGALALTLGASGCSLNKELSIDLDGYPCSLIGVDHGFD